MRPGIATVWLGLAGFGCSFNVDGAGSGQQSGDQGDGLGTTSAQTSTASGSETSTTSPIDTLPITTTSGDADGSSGGATTATGDSSTGEPLPPLVQTGVLARYYLDEASSGQSPMKALDSVAPAVDLPITYVEANPHYTEVGGHRGLVWDAEELDGGPSIPYGGTKLEDDLQGKTSGTIEAVADIRAVTSMSSRVVHFGYDQDSGDFTLASTSADSLQFRKLNGAPTGSWPAALPDNGRAVYTIVFDSQADAEHRARLYVDGMEVAGGVIDATTAGNPISFAPAGSFSLGNRAAGVGQRSFHGVLYYAAVYDRALSPREVADNAAILLEDDDSP